MADSGHKLAHYQSSTTVFGEALLAVGGYDQPGTLSIFIYSPLTCTWEKVGELPESLASTCSITLPSGEMVVIGGCTGQGGSYMDTRAPGV